MKALIESNEQKLQQAQITKILALLGKQDSMLDDEFAKKTGKLTKQDALGLVEHHLLTMFFAGWQAGMKVLDWPLKRESMHDYRELTILKSDDFATMIYARSIKSMNFAFKQIRYRMNPTDVDELLITAGKFLEETAKQHQLKLRIDRNVRNVSFTIA